MKIDINLDKNTFFVTLCVCIMVVVCFITFAIYRYNIKAVKLYTENNYEEISDKGTSIVYWRKFVEYPGQRGGEEGE